MDARTNIESRLPSRHVTEDRSRAPYWATRLAASGGSIDAALHWRESGIADTFKKTLCAADLKPRGRYIAKDKFEIGGMIGTDADAGTLNVKLTGTDLAERETRSKLRETNRSGAGWDYARKVGPAVDGAVTHLGGAYEKQCYADI